MKCCASCSSRRRVSSNVLNCHRRRYSQSSTSVGRRTCLFSGNLFYVQDPACCSISWSRFWSPMFSCTILSRSCLSLVFSRSASSRPCLSLALCRVMSASFRLS